MGAEPTGALVRRLLARRLSDAWGTASNCDVLGLGYATPWLDGFSDARRVIAAMPGGQGAEHYASAARNRSVLVDERRLPFASGLFDRILMVHAIEEADDPQAILIEAARTLSPSGRLIVATAARGGLWARTETTPFGHGRPFSRRQLENLVRGAGLEPSAWSPAVYVPPWRPLLGFADGFEQAWADLEELYVDGKIKAIGMSNFHRHHLEQLEKTAKILPAVNQIESHPYLSNQELIDLCHSKGMAVEVWSPLGGIKGNVLEDAVLHELASKYGKTPAQIVLRWDIQRNVIVIPKSVHRERILSNQEVFDFELSQEDMALISSLNRNQRVGSDPDHFDF